MRYDKVYFSKKVGWESPPLPIPSPPDLMRQFELAVSGNEEAALTVFRWVRFCSSPKTPSQVSVIEQLRFLYLQLFE